VRCAACGQSWPESMRFCGSCGRQLAAPEASLSAERKVVTVLFCDVVGSTARADGADPEDVFADLDAYHSLVRRELERHQGTVEKFIGDAVMAVFGAPVAHDDDAERAVRAGLAVLTAIDRANAASSTSDLQVRIGIATGEVLVNLAARPERGESLVAGDVVNTAARLQTSADPAAVVVGERTYLRTRARLVYEPLAPVTVKGKAAPVQRWRATGVRAHQGTEAGVRSGTRFVGRQGELAALQAAFERAVARPGVELVVVTGEPGVGKSRLVAEFFGWVDRRCEWVRWRQGRCPAYGDQLTCYALGQIVKAEAGILDSDSERAAQDKLTAVIAALGSLDEADRGWVADRLRPLTGLRGEAGVSQGERFTAWRRFLEAVAAEVPLVLVVEDAHWADPELLAFLSHLTEQARGVPIVLAVTARPEFAARAAGLAIRSRAETRLMLAPLSDADTAELLASLLDTRLIDAGLQARLLERAGGNPLFAEQVVGLLTEQGELRRRGQVLGLAAAGELQVPETLSALISARLDTLPRVDKALLGDAAVLGRIFWPGAVAALADRHENKTRRILRGLAMAGFVTPLPRSSIAGQAEYRFSHALVRDAAYAALPRRVRAARHLAAADWLEAQASDQGTGMTEVVAHHAITAFDLAAAQGDHRAVEGLRALTARRLMTAGDQAADTAAAERHYARAADVLEPDDPARAEVLHKWGRTSRNRGEPEQARRVLEEALALAQASDDSINAIHAMLGLARIAADRGEETTAERLSASALALAAKLPAGHDAQLRAFEFAAGMTGSAGRPDEVVALCNLGLDRAPPTSHYAAELLSHRAWARYQLDDLAGAEDDAKAVQLARLHAPQDLPWILGYAAEGLRLVKGPEAAMDAYRESREAALRRGQAVIAATSAVLSLPAMFDLGRWDELLATASTLRPQLDTGLAALLADMVPWHAAVLTWRGALAEAHQLLDPVLPQAREMELQTALPAFAAAATLFVADGCSPEALRLIEEYEQTVIRSAPASWYWGWFYLADIVRACISLGETDHARRLIGRAEPALWRNQLQVRSARAALAEAIGDPAADQLYAQAAADWQQFGHVLEHGLALLGLGRCQYRASDPAASGSMLAARATFAKLGAVMPLSEADSWLGGSDTRTA
jgi:class 3 adenylate cyclase